MESTTVERSTARPPGLDARTACEAFQITAEDSDRALVRLDSYNRPGPFEPVHVHPEQESNVEVLPRPCEFRHRKTDSVTTVTPTRILALGCALRTGAFAHGDFA